MRTGKSNNFLAGEMVRAVIALLSLGSAAFGASAPPLSPTNIFAPDSTPADSIFNLSLFVLSVTAGIFVVVGGLLVYSVVKFRKRTKRRRTGTSSGIRQQSGGASLDRHPCPYCCGFVHGDRSRHCDRATPSSTDQRDRSRRHRSPILVGVSLSRAEGRNRE